MWSKHSHPLDPISRSAKAFVVGECLLRKDGIDKIAHRESAPCLASQAGCTSDSLH
jgi:hypothetical protein